MKTAENPILYITRYHERGEGKPEDEAYSIISKDGSVHTYDLLQLEEVKKIIGLKKADVLVFKNNPQIEKAVRQNGWSLLNPSAELGEFIENKISQEKFLGELASFFPPHEISLLKNVEWKKKPFVLQWAHGHTGDGTVLVQTADQLEEIKNKFKEREAKISEFIHGPVFTMSIVVGEKNILLGNVSYQITGILPFTENPMSTVGNDWALPHTILTEEKITEIHEMGRKIGGKMQESGWKGLFGIDVIHDVSRDSIYLIEINARQPASTTYESKLQIELRKEGVVGITLFEAHIEALKGGSLQSAQLIEINDGAQIVQRVVSTVTAYDKQKLETLGHRVIQYENKKLNSDLLRIQSIQGIMESHGAFNKRGKEILNTLKS